MREAASYEKATVKSERRVQDEQDGIRKSNDVGVTRGGVKMGDRAQ